MKSSLVNMVVVLLGITAVTSSAVGLVYRVTEAPIAQAKLHKKADALAQVLPPFDNTPADEMQAVAAGNDSVYVYTARMGQTVAGYAVESFASGFGGPIRIMVGFGPDGRIRNIQVLEQTETPGLGAKLAEEGNPVQASLLGKSPAEVKMSVRKDGGDIDAITASTISSRAYIQAVSLAYTAFLEVSGADASGWDASSGATSSRQVREAICWKIPVTKRYKKGFVRHTINGIIRWKAGDSMVVAVQNELRHIAEYLRKVGFEVVSYESYAHPIDALVYHGGAFSFSAIHSVPSHETGILLVCADGKTPQQIQKILEKKIYSPLF